MIQPIILAAGKGTRMQSELPKTLHVIAGKAMISRIIDTLAEVPEAKKPIIVIGHKGDQVRAHVGEGFQYVTQTDINGPALGVAACMPVLEGTTDPVLLMYGDNPFFKAKSIKAIADAYEEGNAPLVLATVHLPDFEGWRATCIKYSRVIRNADGSLKKILEYRDTTDEEKNIKEVSPGGFCVDVAWLSGALPRITPSPSNGEYYLTDLIAIALADKKLIVMVPIDPEEGIGVNSPEDAAMAQKAAEDTSA